MRALSLIILALMLGGCDLFDNVGARGPQRVLDRYLQALSDGDVHTAYRQLSSVDRAVYRPEQLRRQDGQRMAYRIGRVREYADIATADVTFEKAKDGGSPGSTFVAFTLVREESAWKVYLGLAREEGNTRIGAITSLPEEPGGPADAAEAGGADEVDAPPSGATASRPTDLDAAARGIELYALKADYYRSYLGHAVPGVEFKLRNRSGRRVDRVVVTVYFQNAAGQTIAHEEYFPVRSTGAGFLNTPPLEPGYVWQLERRKFFLAEAVPSEWKRGAVRAEISEVRFADGQETAAR